MKEGWMKNDKGWMKNDEGRRLNDEEWWFQAVEGFLWLTDRWTESCDCRVAFATENSKKSDIGTIRSGTYKVSQNR